MPAITFPASDGDLITTLPPDQAGLGNWVQRENWRFAYGKEVVREGDVLLHRQDPLDVDEPITGIFHARHPDGSSVVFLCTPSSIYRFLGDGGLELGYVSPVEDFGVFGRAVQGENAELYPVFGKWAEIRLTRNATADDYIQFRHVADERSLYNLGNGDNDKSPRFLVGVSVHQYRNGVRSVGVQSIPHAAPDASLYGGAVRLKLTYTGRSDEDLYAGLEEWALEHPTSTLTSVNLPGDW